MRHLPSPRALLRFTIRTLLVLVGLAMLVGETSAQVPPAEMLRGTVMVGSDPLSEGTVLLHLVSPDSSGNIDSTRVARDGTFSFLLPTVPDPSVREDIYFASIRLEGVLYFGRPISQVAQLDSTYMIQAYQSVVAPPEGATLTVAVRNLFLEPGPEDTWRATDVLQVRNDGDRTLIAADGGVVWSYAFPPAASDLEMGQGDLLPDAVEFVGHLARLKAPVPPGDRFFMVRYTLPGPPFSVPIPGVTESMEVLVREPAAALDVIGLEKIDVVSLEAGSNFRRYGGTNLVDSTISVEAGVPERGIPVQTLAVILALLLGAVGVYAFRRPSVAPTPVRVGLQADGRAALLLEIAQLDERIDAGDISEAAHTELLAQRAALLQRLSAAG
ncbi:MAG: hypothetical protein BMS9Abin29_1515 [Gemmatimonadota bacterium]|nr:MAG: hypothetical protein BMS9Abin29_1515 [Gemmatimonadota bacterium]